MATQPAPLSQNFPPADTPLEDENGILSLTWLQFFLSLWNRTGSSAGNGAQLSFNFPGSVGTAGQVLTSEGAAPTIWTTLATKLSQFTNDVGFLTAASLTGYQTAAQTSTATTAAITAREATTIPPADSATGAVGTSASLARADHGHPLPAVAAFTTSVTSAKLVAGTASWTSGAGAPTGTQPSGSLYSNTSGVLGARLYVSSGAAWTAVQGV
jgi:hypothetical protein